MLESTKKVFITFGSAAAFFFVALTTFTVLSLANSFSVPVILGVTIPLLVLLGAASIVGFFALDKELKFDKQFKTSALICISAVVVSLASLTLFWQLEQSFITTLVEKDEIKAAQKVLINNVFLIAAIVLIAAAALTVVIARESSKRNVETKARFFTSQNITRLAVFTAISYVLYMLVKFNLPFLPSWLDVQFSDMPALLAGFMIGPLGGCLVIIFKILLKLPFSSTIFVGELGDLIIGLALVLPSSLIYKYMKTKKGALYGLIAGVLLSTLAAILLNYFVLIPFYLELTFNGNWSPLVNGLRAVYGDGVTIDNFFTYYILLAVIPFNLARGALSALFCFLVYKRLNKLFRTIVSAPKRSKKLNDETKA